MSHSLHLLTQTALTFPNPKPRSSLFLAPFSAPNRRSPTAFPSLSVKASTAGSNQTPSVLVSANGTSSGVVLSPSPNYFSSTSIEVDTVIEAELKENGFRTKLICTIGPSSVGSNQLKALAASSMNGWMKTGDEDGADLVVGGTIEVVNEVVRRRRRRWRRGGDDGWGRRRGCHRGPLLVVGVDADNGPVTWIVTAIPKRKSTGQVGHGNGLTKKEEILPNYDFHPIRPITGVSLHSQNYELHLILEVEEYPLGPSPTPMLLSDKRYCGEGPKCS
ncbi:hypothetical protein ACLB2K_055659 [Fragaria x ananassa]